MKRTAFIRLLVFGALVVCVLASCQLVYAADKYVINFDDGQTFFSKDVDAPKDPGKLSSEKAQVISGTNSWVMDSTNSDIEWNEMYWTDWNSIKLEPNETYTIELDYRILQEDNMDEYYYFLFRSKTSGPGADDRGWTQWTQDAGLDGHQSVTFELGDYDDYYLDAGIHFTGAIAIDNIEIRKGE